MYNDRILSPFYMSKTLPGLAINILTGMWDIVHHTNVTCIITMVKKWPGKTTLNLDVYCLNQN